MKNSTIKIRDLNKMTPLELVQTLKGGLNIEFEDNITLCLAKKEIVLSRNYWEILFQYPDFVIDSTFVVSNFYKNNLYSSDTHIDFLYYINKNLLVQYVKIVDNKAEVMGNIHSLIHDTTELLYNELANELKEYTTSIDVVDMLDIQMKPDILESIDRVRQEMNAESVRAAHDVFDRVVKEDPTLKDNPAVLAYLSGAVNSGQMKNMLSSPGFKTDSNGKIFPYPIAASHMLGADNMYDVIVEQRTAVKALYLSTRAIQSTETLAKELQLLAMYVERVHINDDCQSEDYLEWFITDDKKDLENLQGSYFLNEETNKLEVITLEEHKHLANSKIKLRNPIGCKHWDKHGICGICFGDLSYQISATSNIGHYSGVNITGPTTQLSLKTKHHNDSASAEAVVLDDIAQLFFNVKNKNTYHFKKLNFENMVSASLIAPQEFLHGIKDINNDNIEKIDIFKVTKIPYVDLLITKSDNSTSVYRINIQIGNRFGVFSAKMLRFILDTDSYEIIEGNKYSIDITKLKENTPVFILPEIEYNYLSLALDLKALLRKVTLRDNPHIFLSKLYNMVNSKLKINLTYISILVRALMVEDLKTKNYDLPSGKNSNMGIAKMTDVIRGRSLSNSLVLGYAKNVMTSAFSFLPENRPNSVLDVLFKPKEAIHFHRRRKTFLEARKNEMKIINRRK